jgi:branched-chain amino acid aminotransferase
MLLTGMNQQPFNQAEIAIWRAEIEPRESFQLQPVELHPSPGSLDAASQELPPGVYTTFRTFNGDKILSLNDQVKRLEQSASLVDCPIHIPINLLREILRKVLRSYPSQEKRVRISMDLTTGAIYILIEPLQIPGKTQYEQGVRVLTVRHQRQNPKAKQTQFIEIADTIRKNYPGDVNDLLMVNDDGFILEGLNSNFFAVRNAEIYTADENVLSGITRETVLKIIRQLEIPYHLYPVHVTDLGKVEEAFLTSASRSVLPIAQIDQIWMKDQVPGPVTMIIRDAYWKYIKVRLEEL